MEPLTPPFSDLVRPAWLRYGVGVAAGLAAIAITTTMPVLRAVPYLVGFVAAFVAGWFGGGGPALLTTGIIVGEILFYDQLPVSIRPSDRDGLLRFLFFLTAAGFASFLQHKLWMARREWALVLQDATQVRKTAESLSVDLQRYRAIFESSNDAIVAKALDGTITHWNPGAERLFGYPAEEMIGQPVSKMMPEDHKQDMHHILGRIRRGERVDHFETVRIHKKGHPIEVSLSVSAIRDSAGRIVGAAKIARDISERRQLEAERERLLRDAQEAVRIREAFLSVAGHELRTPLGALSLMLHNWTLRANAEGDTKPLERLRKAQQQVERLTRLTEDLLDLGRISSGQLELQRSPTELGTVTREAAQRLDETASRTGTRFEIESEPVTGFWDRSRLDQVVTNLLSNAVKFGPGHPIRVRVRQENGTAEITVADQGIGIDKADQTRIFERFERAVSERSYQGIGLGLWIARQVVAAHGGTIQVESEPGHGATFRVRLPVEKAGAA
ncbi:MAG: PAS domain S-box protein [Acidobacteriota bacterium]